LQNTITLQCVALANARYYVLGIHNEFAKKLYMIYFFLVEQADSLAQNLDPKVLYDVV